MYTSVQVTLLCVLPCTKHRELSEVCILFALYCCTHPSYGTGSESTGGRPPADEVLVKGTWRVWVVGGGAGGEGIGRVGLSGDHCTQSTWLPKSTYTPCALLLVPSCVLSDGS